jgi:hypothetical protein
MPNVGAVARLLFHPLNWNRLIIGGAFTTINSMTGE